MSDSKVFMFPETGASNGELMSVLAPLLSQRGVDPNVLLALNNRNNGFGGEGGWFMWVIFLFFLMGWGGNGFGGFGNRGNLVGDAALGNLINNDAGRELLMSAIQGNGTAISQLASTLNCSINSVQTAINSVMSQVQSVGNQVGMTGQQVINAIQQGNCQLGNQLAQCCCSIQDSITRANYENQLSNLNQTNTLQNSINFVNSSVERGFASTAFETAQQTCELKNAIAAQTQVINDKFSQLEMREMAREIQTLRDERNAYQLSASQQQQTQNLINQLRPCPIPAYITCNPFGCQNDNYPYGVYGGSNCGC